MLGVGKNMVSSIRYWLNAFGILENGAVAPWAEAIFRDGGFDPYLEDEGTLWLLHYALVSRRVASIYALTFLDFRREKKVFDNFIIFIRFPIWISAHMKSRIYFAF